MNFTIMFFHRGHRMDMPELCPTHVYDIMKRSWDSQVEERPSFLELMDEIGDLLEEGEKDIYLDLTKSFDATTIGAQNTVENMDYLSTMARPDFQSQMSASPSQSPEDYLGGIQVKFRVILIETNAYF